MSLEYFELLEQIEDKNARARLLEIFKSNYTFSKICMILEDLVCFRIGKCTLKQTLNYYGVYDFEGLCELSMDNSWLIGRNYDLPTESRLLYLLTTGSRASGHKKYSYIKNLFIKSSEVERKWIVKIISDPLQVRKMVIKT